MARTFLTALNLSQNELQNARVQNLATAPSNPVAGQVYYDTTTSRLYYYDGAGWYDTKFGAVVTGITYGQAAANGAATTASRSDHTHGTPPLTALAPSTILPDAAAAVGTGLAPSREDHVHAITAEVAGPSAVGDTATEGVAATFSRADHRHGREGFGPVTTTTAYGTSSANGTAATVARSDHAHGTPTHITSDHTAIILSSLAAPTASLNLNSQRITNLAPPTAGTDAANRDYVDSVAQGIDIRGSVRAASVANVSLTAQGSRTLDGVTLAAGNRVLLKDQTAGAENGIYIVNGDFSLSRAPDADANAEVTAGMFTFVESGTVNADSGWVLITDPPIAVGTTPLEFAQFSGAGQITAGTGMTKAGNTLDVNAGLGMVANPDNMAIDTTITARWKTFVLGTSATAYTVNHALGNQWVVVQVVRNSTPYDVIEADVELTDANNATIRFSAAPPANAYRVSVAG